MEEKKISLTNAEEFVNVKEENKIYYGGDQSWFRLEKAKIAGCGTVVAANIGAYMSKYISCYKELYPYSDFSIIHYQEYLYDILDYVFPEVIPYTEQCLGIWPLRKLAYKMVNYARNKGIVLRPIFEQACNLEEVIEYISTGLKLDRPIAMLIDQNNKMRNIEVKQPIGSKWIQDDLRFHWVTITEIQIEEVPEETVIKISTWGGYSYLKLKQCVYEEERYIGGLFYLL